MTSQLTLVMAQMNSLVGDVVGNTERLIQALDQAIDQHQADIIVFPELTLTGYPPEDLLLRPSLDIRIEKALKLILKLSQVPHRQNTHLVFGYPKNKWGKRYNAAGVVHNGRLLCEYFKQCLPNYLVFDEKRYFQRGHQTPLLRIKGIPVSLTICEDLWETQPIIKCKDAGAKLVLNISASPYDCEKISHRKRLFQQRSQEQQLAIITVNQVGGQDELVFDGSSMAIDSCGQIQVQAPAFDSGLYPVTLEYDSDTDQCTVAQGMSAPTLSKDQEMYQALVLGVKDYVEKNGFSGVILGLSGGIDSALTATIAVDALGPSRVSAVMMPYHYTSSISLFDAKEQALRLGIEYLEIPIADIVTAFNTSLNPYFYGKPSDSTEENIQARCRGTVLMALSNKHQDLVLITGNKSEMAVGYATLYGDMAGGFAVLKDVFKTQVYRLARYRNSITPVIPERVIERPPSAELKPDQVDSDSLPDYALLDDILARYVEQDASAEDLIKSGFDPEIINTIIKMVDLNEYKRRQAPVGVRMTARGFGRDRRYPITSSWSMMD